jgi:hypothetical protein
VERTYSYSTAGNNSSGNWDKVYYLVGKYFCRESVKFGYDNIGNNHVFFLLCDELPDEDRTYFHLKTGINLIETDLSPRLLKGLDTNRAGEFVHPAKHWLTYDEVPNYLNIRLEKQVLDDYS